MRIHHLALRTGDVERIVAFYCEVLGLAIVRDARPASVWLGLDDESVLMIEARGEREPPVPAGSMGARGVSSRGGGEGSDRRPGARPRLLRRRDRAHGLLARPRRPPRRGVDAPAAGYLRFKSALVREELHHEEHEGYEERRSERIERPKPNLSRKILFR